MFIQTKRFPGVQKKWGNRSVRSAQNQEEERAEQEQRKQWQCCTSGCSISINIHGNNKHSCRQQRGHHVVRIFIHCQWSWVASQQSPCFSRSLKLVESVSGNWNLIYFLRSLVNPLGPRPPFTVRSFSLPQNSRPPSSGWLTDAPYQYFGLCK